MNLPYVPLNKLMYDQHEDQNTLTSLNLYNISDFNSRYSMSQIDE